MNRKQIFFVIALWLSFTRPSKAQDVFSYLELSSVSQPQGKEYFQQRYWLHPQVSILFIHQKPEKKYGFIFQNFMNVHVFFFNLGVSSKIKKSTLGLMTGFAADIKRVRGDLWDVIPISLFFMNERSALTITYRGFFFNKINFNGYVDLFKLSEKLSLAINAESFQTTGLQFKYKIEGIEQDLSFKATVGWNIQNETPGITVAARIIEQQ